VVRRGRGARVVALDQQATLPDGTVADVVGGGWEGAAVLDRLGLSDVAGTPVDRLSGGQAKRVALARTLVALGEGTESDLLVLDEPTNHLDLDAIAWLEDRLDAFRGGLVLVTHDRHVLDRLTTRILELDRGAAHVHEGGYASYLETRAERAQREAEAEHKRRNLARAELAWLRRGAPARTRTPKADPAAARANVEGRGPEPARAGHLPLARPVPPPPLRAAVPLAVRGGVAAAGRPGPDLQAQGRRRRRPGGRGGARPRAGPGGRPAAGRAGPHAPPRRDGGRAARRHRRPRRRAAAVRAR